MDKETKEIILMNMEIEVQALLYDECESLYERALEVKGLQRPNFLDLEIDSESESQSRSSTDQSHTSSETSRDSK